jgi:hypothetical protein
MCSNIKKQLNIDFIEKIVFFIIKNIKKLNKILKKYEIFISI